MKGSRLLSRSLSIGRSLVLLLIGAACGFLLISVRRYVREGSGEVMVVVKYGPWEVATIDAPPSPLERFTPAHDRGGYLTVDEWILGLGPEGATYPGDGYYRAVGHVNGLLLGLPLDDAQAVADAFRKITWLPKIQAVRHRPPERYIFD